MKNPEGKWFGSRPTTPDEKTALVEQVFEGVAGNYDLMNDLMSLGIHRLWKNRFVQKLRPRAGKCILDLAGGTGDIADRMAKRGAQVTVCDMSHNMLEEGKRNRGAFDRVILNWVQGNAECLPFADGSFDAVAISFGLRNVARIDDALAEIRRVLKVGGRFCCLEFSTPQDETWRALYDAYSDAVIPALGEIVAHDRASYEYLVESIRKFPDARALSKRLCNAGFSAVVHETLTGGVVAIHSGWRTTA